MYYWYVIILFVFLAGQLIKSNASRVSVWAMDLILCQRSTVHVLRLTAVILVPLVILGVVPKVGKMKAAYKRVAETGDLFSKESQRYNALTSDELRQAKAEGKTDNL